MELLPLAALSFGTALASSLVLTPRLAAAIEERGHTVPDRYKLDLPETPTLGGACVLTGCFLSIILSILLIENTPTAQGVTLLEKLLIYYIIMFFFAIFGIMDDILVLSRRIKLVAPIILVIPFVRLVDPVVRFPLMGRIDLPPVALYFFLAFYVMVVANMANFHASYNGLSTGLSAILMAAMMLKSYLMNRPDGVLILAPLFGATMGFLWFNFPPSRIFPGNSGTFLYGGCIGFFLILQELKTFGLVALTAHIINFLLFLWYMKAKIVPWVRGKYEYPNFGKVDEDGFLVPPHRGLLKFLVASFRPTTERTAVLTLYALTALSCAAGLVLT